MHDDATGDGRLRALPSGLDLPASCYLDELIFMYHFNLIGEPPRNAAATGSMPHPFLESRSPLTTPQPRPYTNTLGGGCCCGGLWGWDDHRSSGFPRNFRGDYIEKPAPLLLRSVRKENLVQHDGGSVHKGKRREWQGGDKG